MNLYLRVLLVYLRSLFTPRLNDLRQPVRIRLRVWPTDLDFNMHMNNGRYLSIMDLGRFDLILRAGLLAHMIRHKYAPVLAAAQMRFRLPLQPFQSYDLETCVLCWDEKWIFMEQRFIIADGPASGAVAAIGLLKGGFFDPATGTTVPGRDLMRLLGVTTPSPEFPARITDWITAEESLRATTLVK